MIRKGDKITLIVTYICTFLSLMFIAIRLICRRIRGERYWSFYDDMWMGLSVIPLLARLGLIHVVITYGTNSVSEVTEQTLGQEAREQRILGSKLVLVSRIVYPALYIVCSLWCMKACILAFLNRLMSAEPKYARAIRVIGIGLVMTFIAIGLGTLLECRPFELYYMIPASKCTKAFGQFVTMGVLNIATDLALIILPLPLIFRARLPVLRKVQLSLLFTVSSAVIIVTIIRMPLTLSSQAMQDSRTLWASIEILVSCVVANAPILNNFYFEWKNKRRGTTQMANDYTDNRRGSGYSMKAKVPKSHSKPSNCKSSDSTGTQTAKGHLSEECLTRVDAEMDGDNVIEVGTPLPDTAPPSPVQPSYQSHLGSSDAASTHSVHAIQATTSVVQSIALASPEVVRAQQSRYYKGSFLGTQVWADQVFPGPRDPSQHVNYGMNRRDQDHNNSAHAHHHTIHSHSRRPSHNLTDIPSLGVLPTAPPRALLNAIANRKAINTRRGNGDQHPMAAEVEKPCARNRPVAAESEEELGGMGNLGTSRWNSISNSWEEGPGIDIDQHKLV